MILVISLLIRLKKIVRDRWDRLDLLSFASPDQILSVRESKRKGAEAPSFYRPIESRPITNCARHRGLRSFACISLYQARTHSELGSRLNSWTHSAVNLFLMVMVPVLRSSSGLVAMAGSAWTGTIRQTEAIRIAAILMITIPFLVEIPRLWTGGLG
jgi:hypothetical protein